MLPLPVKSSNYRYIMGNNKVSKIFALIQSKTANVSKSPPWYVYCKDPGVKGKWCMLKTVHLLIYLGKLERPNNRSVTPNWWFRKGISPQNDPNSRFRSIANFGQTCVFCKYLTWLRIYKLHTGESAVLEQQKNLVVSTVHTLAEVKGSLLPSYMAIAINQYFGTLWTNQYFNGR